MESGEEENGWEDWKGGRMEGGGDCLNRGLPRIRRIARTGRSRGRRRRATGAGIAPLQESGRGNRIRVGGVGGKGEEIQWSVASGSLPPSLSIQLLVSGEEGEGLSESRITRISRTGSEVGVESRRGDSSYKRLVRGGSLSHSLSTRLRDFYRARYPLA